MEAPGLDRETIRERALTLPLVDHGELMTEADSLALLEDLRQSNPILYANLQERIKQIDEALIPEIGDRLTPLERLGFVARTAIASAMQVLSDTGKSNVEINELKRKFGIEVFVPHGDADS